MIFLLILLFCSTVNAELAPRSAEEQRVIDIYKEASRAVVNIETRAVRRAGFFARPLEGSGSGVVIDRDKGLIITNNHVISGAQQIMVTFSGDLSSMAKVIGQDPESDLALLKVDEIPDSIPSLEYGETQNLEVGQRVLAIGNPFGLERTLSTGIISSLGRSIRANQTLRAIEDIIQIDADINPGNSGGPLLDMSGRLIGINTAISSTTGASAGIGLAIPVEQVKRALPQLIKFGRVLRPKIGVRIEDTQFGPMVDFVSSGSPADKSGLQGYYFERGEYLYRRTGLREVDFIVEVNGIKVYSKIDVIDQLGAVKDGEIIALKVMRGGKVREVLVKPELG